MLPHAGRRQLLLTTTKAFDLVVFTLSFLLAIVWQGSTRSPSPIADLLTAASSSPRLPASIALLLAAWYLILGLCGLYRSRRLETRWREPLDVVRAATLATLATALATRLLLPAFFTEILVAAFFASSTSLLLLSRLVIRSALAQLRLHGRNLRYILIVGTNWRAVLFATFLHRRPELGYILVGFVDDEWPGLEAVKKLGYPVVAALTSVRDFLRSHIVDEVVIFVPFASLYRQASNVVATCEEQGIPVRMLANIFDLKIGQAYADELGGIPVTTLGTGGMRGWPVVVKRLLDVVLGSTLLILSLPLLLSVALAIKLTSPGPVLFAQERLGLNKRRFRLYKFRTMVQGAEFRQGDLALANEASGPVFKIRFDPRATPLGRLLRRTSIDELPQLLNVLLGDMSLVGPRPLPVIDYQGFEQDWHRRRFSVRPGLTCLWQVSGRHLLTFDRWMELDLYYIDHWSLWLDLKTLVRTIPAVLSGSGAS